MKPKLIYIIILSSLIALLSSCAPITTPAIPTDEQPSVIHRRPLITWELTDNFIIRSQNFNMDILQILITPEYIMLISSVSDDLGTSNIKQVSVLNDQQQVQGKTSVTTIRKFRQGSLIALTFFGQRQNISKPLFSISQIIDENNTLIDGNWQIAPLELPANAQDDVSFFANGVESTQVGNATIFSEGSYTSPICKGNTGLGGPNNIEAYFTMVVSENGKASCLYTHILKDGSIIALSEKEYLEKMPHP